MQVIANVIDFGMDIQTAITAPRMRVRGSIEAGTEIKPVFLVEDRIPSATMDALRAKDYEIRPIEFSGAVNGIIVAHRPDSVSMVPIRERTDMPSVGD